VALTAGNTARSPEQVFSVTTATIVVAVDDDFTPVERDGAGSHPVQRMPPWAIVAEETRDAAPATARVVPVTGRASRGPLQLHPRAMKRLGSKSPAHRMPTGTIVTIVATGDDEVALEVLTVTARAGTRALEGDTRAVPVGLRGIVPLRGMGLNGPLLDGGRLGTGSDPEGETHQRHSRSNPSGDGNSHGHLPWQRAHVGAALPMS
jgi:hypothetical protein